MEPARLKIETTILDRFMPGRYRFVKLQSPSEAHLLAALRTSAGNSYQVMILLKDDYPACVPRAYLMGPERLKTHRGKLLASLETSHDMHLLDPRNGMPRLCHYKPENWHPNVTLYKVALKCLIWLEAYENHMLTGKPITHYVGD